jgi:hypothetical protein
MNLIEADSETLPEERRRFAPATFPPKPSVLRRDVLRSPVLRDFVPSA